MGSATDVRVVKETTAALESVLPPEELVRARKRKRKGNTRSLPLTLMLVWLTNRALS